MYDVCMYCMYVLYVFTVCMYCMYVLYVCTEVYNIVVVHRRPAIFRVNKFQLYIHTYIHTYIYTYSMLIFITISTCSITKIKEVNNCFSFFSN